MKILYLSTYYLPYISGLTIYAKRLIEGLKDNHNISILSMRYDKNLPEFETSDGLAIHRSNYLLKLSKGFLGFEVIEKSISLINKSDVLIVNQPCFEGLFATVYALFKGKKVISVFLCFVNFQTNFLSRNISFFMNMIVFCQLLLSDKIVVLTKDYLNQFFILKYLLKKVVEIGPPIKIENPDEKYQKKLLNLKKKHQWVGFCGRISREKNLEGLICAIRNIPNIELVMAGPSMVVGEDQYFQKIFNLLDQHKISYHLFHDLSDAKLSAFYQSIDCLVLPSNNSTEALGMVQIEAMMNNTPIVASNIPGVRDPVVKTKMGELFDLDNVRDLEVKIIKILKNKANYLDKDLSDYQIKTFYQKWQELLI